VSVLPAAYQVPSAASQQGIVTGPDGNVWFTEPAANMIGEVNASTGAIAEFPVPSPAKEPLSITAAPDGNLWFTLDVGSEIGQISPTSHAITEFAIPTPDAAPQSITQGPDGNLWFTEEGGNKIGQMNPATHAITEFPVPSPASGPVGITEGNDLALWFTEVGADKIGRIDPATHTITEFPVPTPFSFPEAITTGSDGSIWFTEFEANKIGRVDSVTDAIEEFPIPTASSSPEGIAAGKDDNIWFTEARNGAIGEVNLPNPITEFTTSGSLPQQITSGPDANLWFTEIGSQSDAYPYPKYSFIGKVVLPNAFRPDLALSGSAPDLVDAGSTVTYTLTVTNNGNDLATGVRLTDQLPANVTFDSATGGVTPNASDTLTFTLGAQGVLEAGDSASVSIVVTAPTSNAMFTDSASVRMDQLDPTPSNNSATLTTSAILAAYDVGVKGQIQSVVDTHGNVGVTFTLTVTAFGSSGASGVTLTVFFSGGVFAGSNGPVQPQPNPDPSGVNFNIGNMAAKQSDTFTVDAFTMVQPESFLLKVTSTVSMDRPDPTPDDNSVPLDTTVSMPSMQGTGCQGQTTVVVLDFGTPVDAAWAENTHNYRLVYLDGSRQRIRLKRAVYDAAAHTVTLTPRHQPNVHHLFRLTVNGDGASPRGPTDAASSLAGGQKDSGDMGGDFTAILSFANLEVTTKKPAFLREYKWVLARQTREVKRLGLD
jgi:virginiamycin B lyase